MADELSQFLVKAPKGTVLFAEGDSGDTMFFIHSGKVRIEKNVDGKAEVLAIMEKGDFFGEMAVLDRTPRTATAVVDEDASLLKIDSTNFEKLLKANIEIAVRMIRKYAARLRESNIRLENLMRDKKEINQGIVEIIDSVKSSPPIPSQEAPKKVLAELISLETKGAKFSIVKATATVGRIDPVTNITPDIDLTELDQTKSVSRRHAQISLVDGQFFLIEEIGVANGTHVSGKKIRTGLPTLLENDTKVRFGKVELQFKIKS